MHISVQAKLARVKEGRGLISLALRASLWCRNVDVVCWVWKAGMRREASLKSS